MRKQLRVIIGILVVVIVAVYFLWPRVQARNDRIEGAGTMEATEVDIAPKVAGRVVRILVREGESVQAGQVVAQLDAIELEVQVEQARALVNGARARLAEAHAGLSLQQAQQTASVSQAQAGVEATQVRVPQSEESLRLQTASVEAALAQARAQVESASAAVTAAEANLTRARADQKRLEALYQEGAISAQQLDVARTTAASALAQRDAAVANLQQARAGLATAEANRGTIQIRQLETASSRAQLEQAQAALRSAKSGSNLVTQRASEVEAARAAVAQAEAGLKLALTNLDNATLRSPIPGVILSKSVEVGDLVGVGAPVLTVGNLSQVTLRVFVPETEIGRVKLGQPVDVRVDAFPDRVFRGQVAEISQHAEFTPGNVQTREERVKLVFAVKVRLPNPDGVLKPGLPADALILTEATVQQ